MDTDYLLWREINRLILIMRGVLFPNCLLNTPDNQQTEGKKHKDGIIFLRRIQRLLKAAVLIYHQTSFLFQMQI